MDLFDWAKSQEAKRSGTEQAAHSRAYMLTRARSIAVEVARRLGRDITIDDVLREMLHRGFDIKALGNAAGSIFKGDQWQFTGNYRPSVRISNHGRVVKIWKLVS